MSEFGMQSFPSYEVISYINQSDSLEITSEGFKNHQKHIRGFELIDEYMQRDFPVPNSHTERSRSAEDYVYMSQVVQAYGITKGLESQRRAKPYNMGTLFWQLNDCWPSISWSSIDFLGKWKALHYKAKKAFKNVLVSSTIEDNVLKTYVINDNLTAVTDSLHLKLIDFSGKELWSFSKEVTALENSSELMHELNLEGIDKKNAVLVSNFNNTTSTYYLAKPKDLNLQQAEINQEITKTPSGFKIKLSSSTLQKDVFLFTKEKGHFSDNFFDLLPNETVEIEFNTEAATLNDLKIKTLNQFIN